MTNPQPEMAISEEAKRTAAEEFKQLNYPWPHDKPPGYFIQELINQSTAPLREEIERLKENRQNLIDGLNRYETQVEQLESALRLIEIHATGNDPSDGEGTSPEEVVKHVENQITQLESELAEWKEHAALSDREFLQMSDWLIGNAEWDKNGLIDHAAKLKERIRDLIAKEGMVGDLEQLEKQVLALKEELNWQNNRNSGHPTKGGFEFYINEEWTGLASAALDADYGWSAGLRKHRIDPDDERVRVRRVIEDDAILKELTTKREVLEKLKGYARHKNNCSAFDGWGKPTCDCELQQTLTLANEELKKGQS